MQEEKKRPLEMQVVRRILVLQSAAVRLQLTVTEAAAPTKVFAASPIVTVGGSAEALKAVEERIEGQLKAGWEHIQKYPEDQKYLVEDMAYTMVFDQTVDCGGICFLGRSGCHRSTTHKILRVAFRLQTPT